MCFLRCRKIIPMFVPASCMRVNLTYPLCTIQRWVCWIHTEPINYPIWIRIRATRYGVIKCMCVERRWSGETKLNTASSTINMCISACILHERLNFNRNLLRGLYRLIFGYSAIRTLTSTDYILVYYLFDFRAKSPKSVLDSEINSWQKVCKKVVKQ